jgi:hypothetical protein
MAKLKEETITIQNGEEVIELTGVDKQEFENMRAEMKTLLDAQIAETNARKEARLSALQKLGLTEEEINAIL